MQYHNQQQVKRKEEYPSAKNHSLDQRWTYGRTHDLDSGHIARLNNTFKYDLEALLQSDIIQYGTWIASPCNH